MTNKSTLGVVAISYNEQRDLPAFLEHLLPWVDEIVIVDDGSTDATERIATSAGNKIKFIISPRKPSEYFAQQRNKGIEAATSDWLLHMDIDERVTPTLADEILEVINNPDKDGYRFCRLNYFLHRPMYGGGWQDWNMLHLARRRLFHFEGMFHETCILDATENRIGQLKAKMWHLNDSSYKDRMRKSFNYCEEQAKRLSERYLQITWLHLFSLPIFEFIRKFFFKGGYRDGTLGLLFAMHASGAMFRACALVWDEQHRVSRGSIEQQLQEIWKKDNLNLCHAEK